MATGNLQIAVVAKSLISATASKALAMAVKVGRFIKEVSFVENPAFTDSQAFTVTKVLSDSANFAGEPSLVPARLLANSGGFTDSPVFTVTKILTNAFGTGDSGVLLLQDYAGPDYFSQDFIGSKTTF